MQNVATGSLVDRMMGAARLDVNTYEEVEHDQNGTTGALIVVILAAIAAGIGAWRSNGAGGLVAGIIGGIVGWAVFSGVAYLVGTRLLPGPQTSSSWGELLRTLGFAQTPSLLAVFGFIPVLGPLLTAIGGLWTLIAEIIGMRQALDVTTWRAIAIGIVSVIIEGIVIAIIAAIFGVAIYGLG